MASIRERTLKDGSMTYNVTIRTKDCEECKTFVEKEDAELYIKYKERLLRNKENFDIQIRNRVRLCDVIDLKTKDIVDPRTLSEYRLCLERIKENIRTHTFLCELNLDDWVDCMKRIAALNLPVRVGSAELRLISPSSVRRIFASLSAAFSNAILLGIDIENYPLQVIQKHINPFLLNGKSV